MFMYSDCHNENGQNGINIIGLPDCFWTRSLSCSKRGQTFYFEAKYGKYRVDLKNVTSHSNINPPTPSDTLSQNQTTLAPPCVK